MKPRKDSDEEYCDKTVPDPKNRKWCDCHEPGFACLRTKGHPGECIAQAGAAGKADGVCWLCRRSLEAEHAADCSFNPLNPDRES